MRWSRSQTYGPSCITQEQALPTLNLKGLLLHISGRESTGVDMGSKGDSEMC